MRSRQQLASLVQRLLLRLPPACASRARKPCTRRNIVRSAMELLAEFVRAQANLPPIEFDFSFAIGLRLHRSGRFGGGGSAPFDRNSNQVAPLCP